MENIIAKLLQDFEQGKMSRRTLIRSLTVAATAASAAGLAPRAAAAGSPLKAVSINHITFDVHDYTKGRDFYADLFGLKVFQGTNKNECHLRIGDTYITLRGAGNRKSPDPVKTPVVDHIAIAVVPWEGPKMDGIEGAHTVVAELKRRGIPIIPNPWSEVRIHDPEGFTVQVTGKTFETDN